MGIDGPVFDRTGLTGSYDFTLKWTALPSQPPGPSLSAAVQAQLGLQLVRDSKIPIDFFVIDNVEKPMDH